MAQHLNFSYINKIFTQPFSDLMWKAQTIHRQNFDPNQIQISTLLSIKTGRCPENCAYCPQSAHYNTKLEYEKLLRVDKVREYAKQAQANGATRFCMGGAWRSIPKRDFPQILAMIDAVNELGMETCLTAGMLSDEQAQALQEHKLDFYNHNIDSSPEYYEKIISTRKFQDRLDTLNTLAKHNLKTCCGGIIGMGETHDDRIKFLEVLANLQPQPKSVPINHLVAVEGTPLEKQEPLDPIEFVRTIATARIIMPQSYIRLSAGRNTMSDELQSLCFLAGANSIFYGEKLLTTPLPEQHRDLKLLARLGMHTEQVCEAHAAS